MCGIVGYVGEKDAAPLLIESLKRLAELLAMPVIDRGGRFNFPNTHGLDATDAASDVLANADVVAATLTAAQAQLHHILEVYT